MLFENIIGNENVKGNLLDALKDNNISHSYMFVGQEGIGKRLVAFEYAKAILCLNDNKNLCDSKCKSCQMFDSSNHPDFMFINPDGNSIKITQIREMLSKIYEKPIISSKKVYIIDDADKMTVESNNCLLKILEEPPNYVVIILIVSNFNMVLDTIKSRCNKIMFDRISNDVLLKYLQDERKCNISNYDLLDLFDGSISRAINSIDNIELYNKLDEFIDIIENKDILDIFKNNEVITENKDNIYEILDYMIFKFGNKAKKYYDEDKYINSISIIQNVKNNLNMNSNFDMSIDNMLISLWEEFN